MFRAKFCPSGQGNRVPHGSVSGRHTRSHLIANCRLNLAKLVPAPNCFTEAATFPPKASTWASWSLFCRRIQLGERRRNYLSLLMFYCLCPEDRMSYQSCRGEIFMEDAGIGWIAAIIIGGIAGWLAEMFMKSNMGVIMNILLGIVGAVVANFLLSLFGIVLGGWLGYLIAGFIGACILIALARMVRRTA